MLRVSDDALAVDPILPYMSRAGPPHALQAHSGPARRMFLELGLDDFLGLGAVAGSPVDVGC